MPEQPVRVVHAFHEDTGEHVRLRLPPDAFGPFHRAWDWCPSLGDPEFVRDSWVCRWGGGGWLVVQRGVADHACKSLSPAEAAELLLEAGVELPDDLLPLVAGRIL